MTYDEAVAFAKRQGMTLSRIGKPFDAQQCWVDRVALVEAYYTKDDERHTWAKLKELMAEANRYA